MMPYNVGGNAMQPKSKILIGVFKNPDSVDIKNAPAEGYRFFDLKTGEVQDFNIVKRGEVGKFRDFFKANKDNIQNLVKLPKSGPNEYKFINGAESRYPVIDTKTGNLLGHNSLIIYGAYEDGFGVVDYAGHRDEWSKDQAVAYALINGVANGKVVSKNGGQPYLAAISNEYPEIRRKIRKVDPKKYTDALDTTPVSKPNDITEGMHTVTKVDISTVEQKPSPKIDKKTSDKAIQPEKEVTPPSTDIKPEPKAKDETVTTKKPVEKKPLTEERVVRETKYTDNFYKQLEADFGGKASVLLLKYIVEIRNGSLDTFIELKNKPNTDTKIIPSLAALILRGIDAKEDKNLLTLMKRVIDPNAIRLGDALKESGINVDEVYDSGDIFKDRKYAPSSYLFKKEILQGCLANYVRKHKAVLFNLDYSHGVPSYNGAVIDIAGYKLSGLDIDKVTVTSKDGESTKVIRVK